jgi:hypothetical protein|tara:strand:+ start:1583 stop:1858 length:276 start_codon:yes stop_codon:yes gene_type:complete
VPPAKTKESVTPNPWEDIQDPLAAFAGGPVKNYFLKAISASRLAAHLRNAATHLVMCLAAEDAQRTTPFTYAKSKRPSTSMALWKGSFDGT